MRNFLGKNCKIRLSVGGFAPESPLASGGCVITPACYYNSVEFVSSAKCVFSALKRTK